MPWVSLTVDVPEGESDFAQSIFYDFEVGGLEVRDGTFGLMPGTRAPASGEVTLVGYFEQEANATAAEAALRTALPQARCEAAPVVEKDWSTEWRSRIKSVTVGRLWVGPPWEKDTAPKDKVCLFIEPKMAFGTGDHPTTSLCLAAVDRYLAAHPTATVLDVGTGTGVLAFAAKKLGATTVVGTDNDPVAVGLAKECAEENGLSGIDLSLKTPEEVGGTFDLVLANILANTLIELAPQIAARVGDRLVLAGVLVPQADEVRAAYVAQGLAPAGDEVDGEWIRLELEREK